LHPPGHGTILHWMSSAGAEDAVLLARVAEGRKEALAALYDRYGRIVYGLALRMVADRETAEEITQDVFTSLWRKAGTFRPERSGVGTWISRIARNRAIDELRRRKSRAKLASLPWEEETAGQSPADDGELELERQRVRRAVAGLPREQRQVLSMAFFQGLSHSEIAGALELPLGTVKTWIRAAMTRLRQTLVEEAAPTA
jgi:RNA polymerase sigma-70 factor (ECF subfamily)